MWKLCKGLFIIFLAFLAILCLFFALSIGYISAVVFLSTWFPTHLQKFSRTWNSEDPLNHQNANVNMSPWGLPYDAECGMVPMVFLEMDCLEPAKKCRQKIENFENKYEQSSDAIWNVTLKDQEFHEISKYCFEVASCMRLMACKEGDYHFELFHKYPHSFFRNHSNFPNCMAQFYKIVQDMNMYNCTGQFEFMSKDPFLRNHAYFHGKSCFMTFLRDFCSTEVIGYLHTYYEYFLELALIPSVLECGIYEKLEALECNDQIEYYKKSADFLKISNLTKEDYQKVADSCDQNGRITCLHNITNTCAIPPSFLVKSQENCEKVHFLSSNFWNCLQHLKSKNTIPDLIKYPCFVEHQFTEDSMICLFQDN